MKKATTVEEQIKILKRRGMEFEDEEKAKEILLDIGYYCFPFEKSFPENRGRTHEYVAGTKFTDVVSLYYFDYDLRGILTKYLNRIEVNIRTNLTYRASNYYKDSPTWFVNADCVEQGYIDKFELKVYSVIRDNPVIKRHKAKYPKDDFAPAWKTVEFMTFGNICVLYKNMKNQQVRGKIARQYGCQIGTFINYILTIKTARNVCAHGGCLYNFNLPVQIISGPAGAPTGDDRHNICGIINVIHYIIGKISEGRQRDMRYAIVELFKKDRGVATNAIVERCKVFL